MRPASILMHGMILFRVLTLPGFADDFPSKAIKIILPAQVGGSADINTRKVAAMVGERLGQSVIVDNRPGAAGNIGTALAAKSPPDGYTLAYIVNTTMAVNPHVYPNSGYDALKDFAPIIVSYEGQALLVVAANSQLHSIADLIKAARRAPGKLRYATSGIGSPPHLMSERLEQLADIDLEHVPYKGEPQFRIDLINGQVDVAFCFPASCLPHVTAGTLRTLAVSSSKRFAPLPQVPTLAEAGVAGYDERIWAGFAAPAGLPRERLLKLHQAFQAVLRSPEFGKYLDGIGNEAVAGTPEEAAARIKSEYERYGKIVKELGLRLE